MKILSADMDNVMFDFHQSVLSDPRYFGFGNISALLMLTFFQLTVYHFVGNTDRCRP